MVASIPQEQQGTARTALLGDLAAHRPKIRRHLLAMVHEPDLADDLAQETYARAIERLATLRDPQAGLAWLYRVATNVALDRLRRRSPSLLALDESIEREIEARDQRDAAIAELATALEQSEMSDCVQSYLVTLPDDYRVAILLHDAHGLGNREIAELVGCSLATAKIRVHRARARLRGVLAAACDLERDRRGVLVCEAAPGGRPAD